MRKPKSTTSSGKPAVRCAAPCTPPSTKTMHLLRSCPMCGTIESGVFPQIRRRRRARATRPENRAVYRAGGVHVRVFVQNAGRSAGSLTGASTKSKSPTAPNSKTFSEAVPSIPTASAKPATATTASKICSETSTNSSSAKATWQATTSSATPASALLHLVILWG